MQQHLTTQAVVYSAKNDTEKSFDYILPEYLPGVSRIVKAGVSPEKCAFFAGIGEAGMRIPVKINIIYISEYDGRIKSTAFSEEITVTFTEPFDFTGQFTAVPSCFISSAAAFVQTPRKLSVKLKLKASVTAYAENSFSLFPLSDDENICLLKDTVTAYGKKILPETYFEKSQEVAIDSAKGSISEIIHAHAGVLKNSVSVSENSLDFDADIRLCILFESVDDDSGDVSYSDFDTVVKVSDTLPAENVKDGDIPYIYIDIQGVEPSVSLDAYGDNKLVSLVVRYSVSGFAYGRQECELVTDAFIQNCPNSPEFSNIDVDTIHSTISKTDTLSQTVRTDIREISDISSCSTKIHSVSIEHSEGQFFASAKCLTEILGTNLSGELMAVQAPVILHIPLGGENLMPPDIVPEVIINISDCKAEIKDGALKLDFEVSANGVFVLRTRHRLVSSLETNGNTPEKKSGEIRVYYPQKGEKLWDIAKKYRTSPDRLCAANNTDKNGFESRHTVIIP